MRVSQKTRGFMVITLMTLLLVGPVRAQESKESDSLKPGADMAKMQEIMEKYTIPGPEHARLDTFVGTWTANTTMWMEPDGTPMETVGEAVNRLILDGRFLYSDYSSTFMGQPFHGIAITGFDRFKNRYVTFWIDNMSTSFYEMEGNYKADATVAEDTGVWPDPMSGGTVEVRNVTTLIDKDTHRVTMFMTGPDGKEFKTMEILYSRKKQ